MRMKTNNEYETRKRERVETTINKTKEPLFFTHAMRMKTNNEYETRKRERVETTINKTKEN